MKTIVRRQRPTWGEFPLSFEDLFGEFRNVGIETKVPAVNIKESEKQFELELAVPGYTKSDFDVRIEGQKLMISAEVETENKVETGTYTRKEFGFSSFERSFQLPKDLVDHTAIDAKYESGILKVMLPKRKEVLEAAARKIEIG